MKRSIIRNSAICSILSFFILNLQQVEAATEMEPDRDFQLLDACLAKSYGTTVNILNCSSEQISRLDEEIVKHIDQIGVNYSQKEKIKLTNDQVYWNKSVAKKCQREIKGMDGSFVGILYSGCVSDEHRRRLIWIKKKYPKIES